MTKVTGNIRCILVAFGWFVNNGVRELHDILNTPETDEMQEVPNEQSKA